MDPKNPFRDWLESDPYGGAWVPVARLGGDMHLMENPIMFPWEKKQAVLDREDGRLDWPIRIDGARPSSWIASDGADSWREDSSLYPQHVEDGVTFDPFVAYFRRASGRSWLEPIQGFILYWEAWPERKPDGAIGWCVRDEDGRPDEISRWQPQPTGERGGVLQVRRDKLLDFLHDFQRSLAIFADSNMVTDALTASWIDDGRDEHRRFHCVAGDIGAAEGVGVLLRAITIIDRPPQRPLRLGLDEPKEEMLPFVTGLDKSTGKPVESIHPPDPFLTPVYFKAEVLDSYYADPAHYRIDRVIVTAGDMWSLRIAHTGDGHVHAWLGDIGHLPKAAQQHWQSHAVPYDMPVPAWRLERDLHGSFVEAPGIGPINELHDAIAFVNGAANELAGVPLIREPAELDRDRVATLHVPFHNSIPAFQASIATLAVLVNESISPSFLKAVAAPKAEGSLNRLAEWLSVTRGMHIKEAKELLAGLYALQSLRSKMSSHPAGSEAREALDRAGVDLEQLADGFALRVKAVIGSLDALAQTLKDQARGA